MIRKNVVLPFTVLRAGTKVLEAESWYQERAHSEVSWLEDGGAINDWSYDTSLGIGREIQIDGPSLIEELDLCDTGASFELLHSLHISNLHTRRLMHRETVDVTGDYISKAFFFVESSTLCERIKLTSSLVLKENLRSAPRWAASIRGSICWQDETTLDLEGSGSRFPMRDLPFTSQHRLSDNASWHLEWRPTLLHYSFNSAVTLLLNSERTDFFDRIQAGDDVIIDQVMSAITGEICAHLLGSEDFTEEEVDYPDGSLGAVARQWLLNCLPGRTIADIKILYQQSPATVHTALRGLTSGV